MSGSAFGAPAQDSGSVHIELRNLWSKFPAFAKVPKLSEASTAAEIAEAFNSMRAALIAMTTHKAPRKG